MRINYDCEYCGSAYVDITGELKCANCGAKLKEVKKTTKKKNYDHIKIPPVLAGTTECVTYIGRARAGCTTSTFSMWRTDY